MLLSKSSFCHFTLNEKEEKDKVHMELTTYESRDWKHHIQRFFKGLPQFKSGPREVSQGCKDFWRNLYNNPFVYSKTTF